MKNKFQAKIYPKDIPRKEERERTLVSFLNQILQAINHHLLDQADFRVDPSQNLSIKSSPAKKGKERNVTNVPNQKLQITKIITYLTKQNLY